ncbi:unnamed protein product [Arctogadus glacialis]
MYVMADRPDGPRVFGNTGADSLREEACVYSATPASTALAIVTLRWHTLKHTDKGCFVMGQRDALIDNQIDTSIHFLLKI